MSGSPPSEWLRIRGQSRGDRIHRGVTRSGNYLLAPRDWCDTAPATPTSTKITVARQHAATNQQEPAACRAHGAETAITLQTSAHAMMTAIFFTSFGFHDCQCIRRARAGRCPECTRIPYQALVSHCGDAGQPFVGKAPGQNLGPSSVSQAQGSRCPRDAAAAQPGRISLFIRARR